MIFKIVLFVMSAAASTEDIQLKSLIQNHPLSIVKNDMFKEIYITEKLAYAYEKNEGFLAKFVEAPGTTQNKSTQKKVFLPIMIVDPKLLMDSISKDGITKARLVLYHEFLHYLQWKRANESDRRVFRLYSDDARFSENECKQMWQNEREAYFKECQVAVSWGKPDAVLLGLCRQVNSPKTFDAVLLEGMTNNYARNLIENCRSVWTKLIH